VCVCGGGEGVEGGWSWEDSEQLQGHVRWMLTLTPMVSVMEWQWAMGEMLRPFRGGEGGFWVFHRSRGGGGLRPAADGVGAKMDVRMGG